MRHGFGMGHGYFNDWLNGGTFILIVLLVLAVVAFFAILSENFRKRNHPEHIKLLDILKEKYAKSENRC